jgi:hypothetical protein
VGVGVQPVVTNHDLALVRDMRSHPGDKLQIIHRLLLRAVPAPTITDLALGFQKNPRKNALGPFRAQQLLADKIGQHLAGEDLRQSRVIWTMNLANPR